MNAAKQPLGPGRLSAVGVVLGLLTVAVGAIGIRDALISSGALSGKSTLERGVDLLDGLEPQWWAVALGVVLVLAGLWLLGVGLRPRPHPYSALTADTGVYLRRRDVRRLAARTAEDVDGVMAARVDSRRRSTRLRVQVTGDDPAIAESVRDGVTRRLAALDTPPRLDVKQKAGEAP